MERIREITGLRFEIGKKAASNGSAVKKTLSGRHSDVRRLMGLAPADGAAKTIHLGRLAGRNA